MGHEEMREGTYLAMKQSVDSRCMESIDELSISVEIEKHEH
jgi:hypothetical protein